MASKSERADRSGNLVQSSAERLREMIYAAQPGERIGSLRALAERLDVGIVTLQQAARVLEHEGLLEARRGPGGGYYGRRPDAEGLERLLAAYLRSEPTSWQEVLDITSLLFNELAAAAADCRDEDRRERLRDVLPGVEAASSDVDVGRVEQEFQDVLFEMVERPLFALLTRVALQFPTGQDGNAPDANLVDMKTWRRGRKRIIGAILAGDAQLARFEANRSNREVILKSIASSRS